MRRLLLVSYYYPPLGGSGVFRPLRLSRYLPQSGWEVTVLTVTDRVRLLKDPSLLGDVPASVKVERTATLEPRTPLIALNRLGLGQLTRRLAPWFMVPDEQRGWVPFAVRSAVRVLHREPHHALLSTAAPYSAHLVGRALKRRFGLPWVADFRDEWTTNPYLKDAYPTAWHRAYNRRLERGVLEEADRVVCVSLPWLEALRSLVPAEPDTKFREHPNGWDEAHFPVPLPPPPRDRFRILYTGVFYGHRSPRFFLEAIRQLLASGEVPRQELEVLLVGHTGFTAGLGELPAGVVRVVEHRPYFEVQAMLAEAASLLLVIPKKGGPGNHTGKLFPYLASGRPILALAPEPNVAAALIKSSRSGVVVPPDDPGAIARAIATLYRSWKHAGGLLPDQDRALIGEYEARPQAARFARMLDELVAERRAAASS